MLPNYCSSIANKYDIIYLYLLILININKSGLNLGHKHKYVNEINKVNKTKKFVPIVFIQYYIYRGTEDKNFFGCVLREQYEKKKDKKE